MRAVSALYVGLCACGFQPAPALGDEQPSEAGVSDASGDAPRDGSVTNVCDPNDLGLRACFVFDGTTTDGSSYHNNASATGTTFTTGHTGQAIVTGAASNVTVAPTTSLDVAVMTLKLWIRPTTLPGVRAGLIDSAGRFRIFLQAGGAIRCALTGGADLTSPIGAITTGAWQRVTCTYDQATMKIYVNGAMVAMLPQSGTIPMPGSGIVIGQNNPTGEQLDGAIDELQVWGSIVAP